MRRAARVFGAVRRRLLESPDDPIVSVATALPLVALTFDDGPSPLTTRELLAVLARHGANATHFLVGEAAVARPDLVDAIIEAGDVVASHTYSHVSLVRMPPEARRDEIQRGEAALGVHASGLFRPPYGHYDRATARDVKAAGLQCVYWSGHAEDWVQQDARTLAARLRKAIKPGAIVLLHEALYTASNPVDEDRTSLLEALDTVLGELSSSYRFGTLPELLAAGRPVRALIEQRGEDAFVAAQRPGGAQSGLHS